MRSVDRSLRISKRQLQQLIGLLAFLTKALVASRTFLRRLIDATCGLPEPSSPVCLEGGVDGDLSWWQEVLLERSAYNMTFQHSTLSLPQDHDLATDSSLFGCGATFRREWFSFQFPDTMGNVRTDIVVKELTALALAVCVWTKSFTGSRILIHCDNEAVNAVVRSGTSKNPAVMELMRYFVKFCIKEDVTVTTSYVRSADNTAPDLLSRLKVDEFQQFCPLSKKKPCPVVQQWRDLYTACLEHFYGRYQSGLS